MRSTSIPETTPTRLSATARICLPMRVRARKSATSGATTKATATATACPGERRMTPIVKTSDWFTLNCRELGASDDEDDVADQQAETDADERDGDRAAATQGAK